MKIPSSYSEARLSSSKFYFSGTPCPHGHVSVRYTSSQTCRECNKIRSKREEPKKAHIYLFCQIFKAAKSCESRKEFSNDYKNFYLAASKRGILSMLIGHMPPSKTRGVWTFCRLVNVAKNFSTIGEFSKTHSGGYEFAVKIGAMPIISAHMARRLSDYDAVYLWGFMSGADFVCKIGVTSRRLGYSRLNSVSRKSGLCKEFEILAKSENALAAESILKTIGDPIEMPAFNGSTEFRKMTTAQFSQAYGVIYDHASTATI